MSEGERLGTTPRTARRSWWLRLGLFLCGAAALFSAGVVWGRFRLPPYDLVTGAILGVWQSPLFQTQREGRFLPARSPEGSRGELTPEQQRRMDELDSLGYLSGTVPPSSHGGVTVYRRDLAYEGLNLLYDGHRAEVILMDMDGHALYRWRYPFERAFPDAPETTQGPGRGYWRHVTLLPDGGLLGIYEGQGLVRIDRRSRLVWAYPGHAHHDLQVLPDGTIYVLTRKAEIMPSVDPVEPVLDDYVTVLTPDGRERRRVSLVRALQRSPYAALLTEADDPGDLLHTNALEILDGRLAQRIPAFARGNVLISMAAIDTIAVVDMEKEAVVWAMTGLWRFQHAPTVLESGRLLLFDNQGDRRMSRVVEIDPVTQEIRWLYSGAVHGLYSETCGTVQRLPNGNTLITESDNGRALEVTPSGRTVWEYFTPHRAGEHEELIATLFEALRISRRDVPWLASSTGPGRTSVDRRVDRAATLEEPGG